MNRCDHPAKTLGRTIDRIGRDMLWERCDVCGANANGSGIWVSKAVVYDVTVLPVFEDHRTPAVEPPPALF